MARTYLPSWAAVLSPAALSPTLTHTYTYTHTPSTHTHTHLPHTFHPPLPPHTLPHPTPYTPPTPPTPPPPLHPTHSQLLKNCVAPTQKMISNLIHIELAYINTSHPDFIGGKAAVAQVRPSPIYSLSSPSLDPI